MAREIHLVKGDIQKVSYLGFSWTTFFFNYWVPLFRRDWEGFSILIFPVVITALFYGRSNLVFQIILSIMVLIFNIVGATSYNKYHTKKLISNGFKPSDERSEIELKKEGIFYN